MKSFLFTAFILVIFIHIGNAQATTDMQRRDKDSVALLNDSDRYVYYQKAVVVNPYLPAGAIYERAIEFMASKNFSQTYGNDQNGKLIFTTTQDLNLWPSYIGDQNDDVYSYTVQFSITLDIKNGRYRYTINNVVFFYPEGAANKRETLLDIYLKKRDAKSKTVSSTAKAFIDSFERYVYSLAAGLRGGVEQHSAMYNSNF
jgi:hypothetical protein